MRAPGLESWVLGFSQGAESAHGRLKAARPGVFHVKHFRETQWF
jgi:hypothetical protein